MHYLFLCEVSMRCDAVVVVVVGGFVVIVVVVVAVHVLLSLSVVSVLLVV